ncbi:hypothetical protein BJY52DRAFT_1421747 [Lactarius psammicola]|nr:hypothetical protein BJY52DRAFT_1421747 [Lactarius psammicola]
MVPKYTVHNPYLNVGTTVTVYGLDARSITATVPQGAAIYVQSVRINNVPQASPSHFDFLNTFRPLPTLTTIAVFLTHIPPFWSSHAWHLARCSPLLLAHTLQLVTAQPETEVGRSHQHLPPLFLAPSHEVPRPPSISLSPISLFLSHTSTLVARYALAHTHATTGVDVDHLANSHLEDRQRVPVPRAFIATPSSSHRPRSRPLH